MHLNKIIAVCCLVFGIYSFPAYGENFERCELDGLVYNGTDVVSGKLSCYGVVQKSMVPTGSGGVPTTPSYSSCSCHTQSILTQINQLQSQINTINTNINTLNNTICHLTPPVRVPRIVTVNQSNMHFFLMATKSDLVLTDVVLTGSAGTGISIASAVLSRSDRLGILKPDQAQVAGYGDSSTMGWGEMGVAMASSAACAISDSSFHSSQPAEDCSQETQMIASLTQQLSTMNQTDLPNAQSQLAQRTQDCQQQSQPDANAQ